MFIIFECFVKTNKIVLASLLLRRTKDDWTGNTKWVDPHSEE